MPYKDKAARKANDFKNRTKLLAYYAKYDQEHIEEKKAWRTKHYAVNKKSLLARKRKWILENKEISAAWSKVFNESFKGRHCGLRKTMRGDGVPKLDLLWNFNFYVALIQDLECHYCLGPLNRTGGGLDRVDNNLGHLCYNVVPCCRKCNSIKEDDILYEEMMTTLVPALRKLRISRLKIS
jgi:hypothetical protein